MWSSSGMYLTRRDVRFDLTWRVKAEWGKYVPFVTDIISNPGSIEVLRKYKKGKKSMGLENTIVMSIEGECE